MHPNPIFRQAGTAANLAFAARTGAGLFTLSNGDAAPLAAQAPFVIEGDTVLLHLMRSNPVARAATAFCRLIVTGPQAYVSPDWYGAEHQVPTWNYVSVHLTGPLEVLPQDLLPEVLAKLSAVFEDRLLPKSPWTLDKMPKDLLDRLYRSIQPFRMRIEALEGTWKLSQNKTEEQRLGAAKGVADSPIGLGNGALAALMRDPPG